MAWHDSIINKVEEKVYTPFLRRQKMTFEEQQRFLNLSHKVMKFVLGIAGYVTIAFVLFWFNDRIGFEKTILIAFIILINQVGKLGEKK